jgi:predicted SnoaL-like aldol condensation-catalyzing enzyme
MSAESNKAVVRELFEVALNRGDAALATTLLHPEFVDHDPIPGQPAGGEAAAPYIVGYLRDRARENGQPSPGIVIDELVAEGDQVAMRWHAGPLKAFVFLRVRDGRVIERRAAFQR